MQREIITSTITWHLGLVGSNNFGEYTSFSPFTLVLPTPTDEVVEPSNNTAQAHHAGLYYLPRQMR